MRIYIATHTKAELRISFTYDDFGNLVDLELLGVWKEEQIDWVWKKFPKPTKINQMWELCDKKQENWEFLEKPTDLSFKAFYDFYGNKKGGPLKAQELWKKLPDDEKVEVLLFIPKYKAQKQTDGTALKYPEFFLRAKPWLAEKI